ncbi:MAG: GAF domain-containing protein [Oligoflexia bacterium]|nr:GAF domain-containing protein [Oligoflexia bacterium]
MSSNDENLINAVNLDLAPPAEEVALLNSQCFISDALLALLVKNLSFKNFVQEMLAIAERAVPCKAGSIFEVNHEQNSIFIRAASGHAASALASFTIPMGEGIVGHVAESRQPMLVSEVGSKKMHLRTIEDVVGFEARNILAAPIVVRGKLYGVIELLNRENEAEFSKVDLQVIQYFCVRAARALEVRFMLAGQPNAQASVRKLREAA